MSIESIVTIIAVLASTVSVLTSIIAFKAYKKDIYKIKLKSTEYNRFIEVDEELIGYIHRIKKNERKAPLSVVVTESELSILNKYTRQTA